MNVLSVFIKDLGFQMKGQTALSLRHGDQTVTLVDSSGTCRIENLHFSASFLFAH